MHRAILNVVSNALDAVDGGEAPTVTISMRILVDSGRVVAIDVTDMDLESRKKCKAKFFSAFESTKGSHGTGLGLPVSQKILQEHSVKSRFEANWAKGPLLALAGPSTATRNFLQTQRT